MTLRFALLAAALYYAPVVFSQELPEPFVPVRPLGMGNAFTAVSNDENAIWTNPAGIARARKARTRNWFTMKTPNVGGGANARGRKLYQAQMSNSGQSLADTASSEGDLGSDKPYWANVQAFPIAMFDYNRNTPGAFGLFSNSVTKILMEKETPEQARVDMTSDLGGVANVNWTTNNNRFTVGAQARYIMRYAYEDTIPTDDLQNKTAMQEHIKEDANQTNGIGLDAGMLFTVADFWFPTIGFSVLNLPTGCQEDYLNPHSQERETVCGNKFSGNIQNEDALSVVDPTDIRAGFAISPRITRDVTLRIAMDAHHLAIPSGSQSIGLTGVEPKKMFHAGMELFLGNPLQIPPVAVRAGLNQGFLTSGFSFNLGFFALDFATYGIDVSSQSKSIEDRRYVTSLTLVF